MTIEDETWYGQGRHSSGVGECSAAKPFGDLRDDHPRPHSRYPAVAMSERVNLMAVICYRAGSFDAIMQAVRR